MPNNYPLDPQVVDEIARSLEAIVADPNLYTAAGKTPRNMATSKAKLPGVELTTRAGGGAAAGMSDNMLKNPKYATTDVNAVMRELQKANIDRILSQIDLNLPSSPPPARPGMLPAITQTLNRMGPVGLLLELLTQSTELNQGEDEELARRRQQPMTRD